MNESANLSIAAITMVYNEPVNLPIWEKYYGGLFGNRHTFIVDHGSDDGSTNNIQGNSVPVPRGQFDDNQRSRLISKLHEALLEYYDVVLYTDCDEFLIPDPEKYDNLVDYISRMEPPCATPVGLNVVQLIEEENEIDLSQSILSQRRYVVFRSAMCKTLISRIPISWSGGFHASSRYVAIDPDLYLFHLSQFDLTNSLNRLRITRDMDWKSLRANAHQRMSDDEMISAFRRFSKLERKQDTDFKFEKDIKQFANACRLNDTGKYDNQPRIGGSNLFEIPERFKKLL